MKVRDIIKILEEDGWILVRTRGFGSGNASTFMWDAELSALFRLSQRFLINAGYRQFRYTRTDGEGDEAVKTTMSVIGPSIGLSIGIF